MSIHALREEGDSAPQSTHFTVVYFYPRPPRGGRPSAPSVSGRRKIFLSTPSARRATRSHTAARQGDRISIHALREEGDIIADHSQNRAIISIHALREEGDFRMLSRVSWQCQISIHALREEGDPDGQCIYLSDDISIHALREEGDVKPPVCSTAAFYFYPRPPRGGRPGRSVHISQR